MFCVLLADREKDTDLQTEAKHASAEHCNSSHISLRSRIVSANKLRVLANPNTYR